MCKNLKGYKKVSSFSKEYFETNFALVQVGKL